ncbi:MAG: SUMF1/EgtB/PvdO family nonheme iron enzyme [Chromatiaceae bacterium]|nr:SUMF1/EgtB/PvdO family nonheme iron enzyme [Gammaproteobacteria bacterium]MCP5427160.1 SUMF1/EgtB/PvdO family nonheme iron enzyme [Chromatiaceae bacterium]MCB1870689.1 SUMF1/EgtB/PvdO family nonheme iron enzyme [Gammaproteobacteria bacterium]MCB1881427.1 SUMF1/EgtB/PvdO family nonheme iron enzyme [Gammaproteobacteria bacterium]MCB1903428.1 SUMF1/EgtB/PvdO family nonheme iron enzyme [Gammaproteobacteria bacterium]
MQNEIERLKQLLDESQSACNKSILRADQLATTAAEDKAEVEQLRDELKSFREDASRFSREDDRKIRHLQREKQDLEKKTARLKSEVAELRAVIQQYVGEIKNGIEGGVASALTTELDLVRQQAETDVNRMREQLKARELTESAGLTELDELRQEFDSLQQSGEEYREALTQANSEQQRLQEELEERRAEMRNLQLALEAAREEIENSEQRRRDQIEIRKQVEVSLDEARVELERLRMGDEVALTNVLENRAANAASSSTQRTLVMVALAVLVAFILAEGVSILSGRGELISGLLGDDGQATAFEFPALEKTELTHPQLPIEQQLAAIETPVNDTARKTQNVANQPQADRPASVVTLRDPLRMGGSGPVMIRIRGSEFKMGQRRDQLAANERPLHAVVLKNFAIGKYEVTFDEYQLFARATGRKLPADQGWGRGQRPVINVSWSDADAYARWLTVQTGKVYRLPTEAEWEFAAGGGMDSFYWWGYSLGENRASCFDCGSRWDGKSTAPVGSFPANPFSLNDTAGNVMEWVADCYHANYQGAPTDGSAWLEKGCTKYVARGGAYNKPGDSLHTTRRFHYQRDTKLPILGFRVAREAK